MKIIEWAIIFILLAFPMYWVSSEKADERLATLELEQRYNAILRTAAQDGSSVLNQNENPYYEAGYASAKYFRVNKEAGLETLLQTLYLGFRVEDDPIGQQALLSYIPAIVVMDYDGYYLYGIQDWTTAGGEIRSTHGWSLKKPYTYTDSSGFTYYFHLDGTYNVYFKNKEILLDSRYDQLADWGLAGNGGLLERSDELEAVRRTTTVQSIELDLQALIARHNRYAAHSGIEYTFTLPAIDQEEWNNTLDDVGILLFLQGIPLGQSYYNNFALGGGRLLKREPVIGGINEQTGIKYYYPEACAEAYRTEETFSNEREAAAEGYFAAKCLNTTGH